MADAYESQDNLAALDSRSPTPRQKRRYRRWSDEEKKRLLSQRDRDSTITWKEFEEKYYPGWKGADLQKKYSEFKSKFGMSASENMKKATQSVTPKSASFRLNQSDCSSSGEDIPHSDRARPQAKKPRITDRQVSRDPRRKPTKPFNQLSKAPQIEIGPTNTRRAAETPTPLLSTSPQATDVSVTNTLQGDQDNCNTCTVQESSSPKVSHNIQHLFEDMEIYWPPESQQSMNQLVRQALVDQRERLFKKMSQMKQDLTSTSDQLRVFKEEKCDLEAENLRLRTEVEGLQSEKGELKSKCDDLQQFKTTITTAVHQQAGKENTQMSL